MTKPTLTWDSPLYQLTKRKTKALITLEEIGFTTISDLLNIIPLRIDILPPPAPFSTMKESESFQGLGRIVNIQKKMNFHRKGKNRAPLYNLTLYTEDLLAPNSIVQLQFFNCYPSVANKLEQLSTIIFQGKVQTFNGSRQVTNPTFQEYSEGDPVSTHNSVSVIYPTINSIKPTIIQGFFEKIPSVLWESIEDPLSDELLSTRDLMPLKKCYQIMHGVIAAPTSDLFEKAKERLIYNDFFTEQIKILVRRQLVEAIKTQPIPIDDSQITQALKLFPYELTPDQSQCLNSIFDDFSKCYPMMKLIQGDVGSGKTTVAILASITAISNGSQVALMCPTESLALQHFKTISSLLKTTNITVDLLIGGQKESIKKQKRNLLRSGETQFAIGTHSLIQESVEFKNLSLAIIDEQHKFGVNQRIKLTQKGSGVHTLIMTATPIPRSLSLTQYGDLDVSVIKTMPLNRKGIKTRIVTPATFEKFLVFINTRLSLGEQIYIVVPAIFEQEEQSFLTLEKAQQRFSTFFSGHRLAVLHGKMKTEEKAQVLEKFSSGDGDILLATSVIEVGIDIPNATTMAILSPERFGLSSLHQLRGRVGRGEKPGFCFLVTEKPMAKDSMARLQVLENSTDGFYISEKDLELRGEGNLFGTDQSGEQSQRMGNILTHGNLLEYARDDLYKLVEKRDPWLMQKISQLMQDQHIIKTI